MGLSGNVPGNSRPHGHLAFEITGRRLPLRVLGCARGHYLGTVDEAGPVSRESAETWSTPEAASHALANGPEAWTQRDEP